MQVNILAELRICLNFFVLVIITVIITIEKKCKHFIFFRQNFFFYKYLNLNLNYSKKIN